jgi:hypothetical protein
MKFIRGICFPVQPQNDPSRQTYFPSRFATASVDFLILNFSFTCCIASPARTRNARRACDFPLAGRVRPCQQPKDLPRAPNLMRETRWI